MLSLQVELTEAKTECLLRERIATGSNKKLSKNN